MAMNPTGPKEPKDNNKTPVIREVHGLVSEKDLTIKFLEFKNEIDRRFSEFRAEIEKRFNDLERRIDVINIKLNLLIGGFLLMISGGGYMIKLLLEMHK